MDSDTFSEEELAEILMFIRGEGKSAIFGPGIATYPDSGAIHARKHKMCLELERRGLVRCTVDEPIYAFFVPA